MPTPVNVVVDKLLTVRVVAPTAPIKFVFPFVTSKFFSTSNRDFVFTTPLPIAPKVRLLLEFVVVILFPVNIISSNIIFLFGAFKFCTINVLAVKLFVEVTATLLVAGVIISCSIITSSCNLTDPDPLALSINRYY